MNALIESLLGPYQSAAAALRASIAGLTPAQLNATPIPGTWSIQQIVLHIMDDELIWTDRVKRILTGDNPPIVGFNESRYASDLHYDLWSADDAISIFDLTRRNFARVLRLLPDSALARTGQHSETGSLSLSQILPNIVHHVDHHLKFIHQKRKTIEAK